MLKKIYNHWQYIVILLMATYIAFITAWLGDDIMISLRQVWNAIHGFGYTWNFEQRIQTFTCPTWILALTGLIFITRELFLTTILFSIVLSLCSVFFIIKHNSLYATENKKILPYITLGLVFLLLCSKSYTDFMTSGMENSMSYFLAGLFIYLASKLNNKKETKIREAQYLFILLALLFLNRFDYALLFFPVAIYIGFFKLKLKNLFYAVLPGGLIIIAWFSFSLIYFGFLLPNTFYAKLAADYPTLEVLEKGIQYYIVTFEKDPLTLVLIALGILVGIFYSKGIYRYLSLGIIFYCFYIGTIGDFMLGRFFAVPVYISIFILAASLIENFEKIKKSKKTTVAVAILLFVSIFNGSLPILSTPFYSRYNIYRGVADERGYYYQKQGLLSPKRKYPELKQPTPSKPKNYQILCGHTGRLGFEEPQKYFVDQCALVDVFLARLPAIRDWWRIGHHFRKIPTDYALYLINGTPLKDKNLQPLLDDITTVISGDLFSKERFAAMVRLNITKPYHFAENQYKDPSIILPVISVKKIKEVMLENIPNIPLPEGTSVFTNKKNIHIENDEIILLKPASPILAKGLTISLDCYGGYKVLINSNITFYIPKDTSCNFPQPHVFLTHELPFESEFVKTIKIETWSNEIDYHRLLGYIQLNTE